jgi:hypothetical protein
MAARSFRSIPSLSGALLSVSHRRAEPSLLAHVLLATYGRYLPASSRAPPINAGRLGEDAGRNSNGSGDAFDPNAFDADEPAEALPSLAQRWSRKPAIERARLA